MKGRAASAGGGLCGAGDLLWAPCEETSPRRQHQVRLERGRLEVWGIWGLEQVEPPFVPLRRCWQDAARWVVPCRTRGVGPGSLSWIRSVTNDSDVCAGS